MSLHSRRISRVVGLSTENTPASLPRTHCPDLKNVVIDKGGICEARAGYQRLSSAAVKDSSWRFRGEFISATYFQEFWDGLKLPFPSQMSGADRTYYSINLTLRESGALKRGPQSGNRMIVAHIGDPNAPFMRIWLDGQTDWKATILADAGAKTVTVADSSLVIGSQRMIEFGYNLTTDDDEMTLRVIDVSANTSIGTATTSGFDSLSANTDPIFIAAWPHTDGERKLYDTTINGITAGTDEFGHFSASEFRTEANFGADASPSLAWSASNGMESRELRPEEYSAVTVYGYWKLNDADRTVVRDSTDVDGQSGLHARIQSEPWSCVLNTPPQWVSKENSIPADVSQNSDVSGNTITSLPTIHDYALLLGGQNSLVYGRTGDRERFITGDPLVSVFAQTPDTGDGWTLQVVFTPLMDRGETAYPDTTLYASSVNNTVALNPITIEVVSDEFKASFYDGTATKTITLTGENSSLICR